jgi:hypothetical protein
VQRACDSCGGMYEQKRPNHRFCCGTCRVNGARGKLRPLRQEASSADSAPGPSELVGATRRQLEEAGRLDTYLGQQALVLAEVFAAGKGTTSGLATISRELRETMAAALRGAGGPQSAVLRHRDEVAAARARRGA